MRYVKETKRFEEASGRILFSMFRIEGDKVEEQGWKLSKERIGVHIAHRLI
jgi:hypothetical protein